MNKHYPNEKQQQFDKKNRLQTEYDEKLGERISLIFESKAKHIHFSAQMRHQIMQQLPSRHQYLLRRRIMLTFSMAGAALLLILALLLIELQINQPSAPGGVKLAYVIDHSITTPAQLSNGGSLVSLDPTGHNLVYTPANQPGVFYTTDLTNPVQDNVLAMQEARDMTWAPDGTALVTTIQPVGTAEPLLAMVEIGKYMHLLGHDALAASWEPTSNGQITYATLTNGVTQFWIIRSDGSHPQLLTSLTIPFLLQRMVWSPDGHTLALIGTTNTASSPSNPKEPGQVIFSLDMRTGSLEELVSPGEFIIGRVAWSPDGQTLTYEQINTSTYFTLQGIDSLNHRIVFSLPIGQQLQGWSWSPDSRALVYSSGGTLHAYTKHGLTLQFPPSKALQTYPLWLPDGHLLIMSITNQVGQLTLLNQSKK